MYLEWRKKISNHISPVDRFLRTCCSLWRRSENKDRRWERDERLRISMDC